MTSIYFANPGAIDPDVIRFMGVSVKTNDNPIGYFGTGLKYAIATLLRTGHKVSITTNYEHFEFGYEDRSIRGENFPIVTMNDEPLGFTLDLGKNWDTRAAYRELHSNCIDEGGKISDKPLNDETVIKVTGPEIGDNFYSRHEIFLESNPKISQDGLEVHPGSTRWLYYRGVAVYKLPKKTRFTYNMLLPLILTEDRTIRSSHDYIYKLEVILPRIPDQDIASTLLDIGEEFVESQFDWDMCGDPSEEFLDVAQNMLTNVRMNKAARTLVHRKRDVRDFNEVELTMAERTTMIEACNMLKHLNVILNSEEIRVVEELGPNILAVVKDKRIYVTRRCIANGRDFLMITLYEEWIHRDLGYPDESRSMQQHLFDKILQLVREKSDDQPLSK